MDFVLNQLKDKNKLFWLIIILTIVLRIPTLFVEVFNGDEAHYATAAMVILEDGVPYVDFVDRKPPLIYYIYALTFKVFGIDIRYVHLLVILLVLGSGFFLYKSLALFSYNKAGLLAALFYGLFSPAFVEQDMWAANAEIIMNFFMCVSVYLFLRGAVKKSLLSFFMAGFFLMGGMLIKQQGGILYSLFFISLIYFSFKEGLSQVIKQVFVRGGAVLIGSLVPLALCLLYFYKVGALEEFTTWNIQYNFDYLGESPDFMSSLVKGIAMTIGFIASTLILWVLAIYFFRNRKEISSFPNKVYFLFVAWALLTFPAVFVGGRFFGHYYVLFYPSIAALGGLGASYFLTQIDRYSKKIKVLFVVGLILPPLLFEIFGITRLVAGGYQSAKPFIKEVALIVEKESEPEDTIFSWGLFPYPYYYAKRLPASPFISDRYLVPIWKNRLLKHKTYHPSQLEPYHVENMNTLMRYLEMNNPKVIVDVQGTKHLDNWRLYEMKLFPRLNRFVKENYQLKHNVEGVRIYTRNLESS